MDDVPAIETNASIQRFLPPGSAFSPPPDLPVSGRPVVNVTLAINYAVNRWMGVDQRHDPEVPRETVGYRLLNILFHLCTGALLFGVLRRAMRESAVPEDWRAAADPLAGAVCALWLLHPIQSEVINYITQRTEGLASLFYVATLYCSIRAWDAKDTGGRIRWYALGVTAALFGMGSKEIVISVPLAVVLYDRVFRLPSWRAIRRPGNGRGWLYLALATVCAVSFALLALGARGSSAGFNLGMKWYDYFYTQCWAVAHYVRLVLWPSGLTIDYGTETVTGAVGLPGFVLLSVFGVATLVAWTRVQRWGWFAYLGTWFFMLLAPSSSFVPIPTEIAAERRIYLALAALLVLAVAGVEWLRRRFASAMSTRQLCALLGGVAAVLAVGTAARSRTYSTGELLWRDAAAKVPGNPRAVVNLGAALVKEQPPRYAEAESLYRRAMAMDTTCHFGCAQLAAIMTTQGQVSDAASLLQRALSFDPGNAPLERQFALVLMKLGSFDRAIPHLAHVALNYPTPDHLVVLAVAYFVVQRPQDGIATFQEAARRYPDNTEIRTLASQLYAFGRSEDAVPHLKELAITLAKGWQQ
jgi:Tfp pilus assembly protein PilF